MLDFIINLLKTLLMLDYLQVLFIMKLTISYMW
nr:MAG TPA: hypothetical protein [Caudoviricetes sp.]